MSKQDELRASITEQIIKAIESGCKPWVRPWSVLGATKNAISKHEYQGINVFLTWLHQHKFNFSSNLYLSFNQARELGCQVKKRPDNVSSGGWGCQIIFYSQYKVAKADKDGNLKESTFPIMRTFTVFNAEQIDGEPVKRLIEKENEKLSRKPIESDELADKLLFGCGIQILHEGNEAAYFPKEDVIRLPPKQNFRSKESYYQVGFHELAHASGHETRCDRVKKWSRFGSEAYAIEELVAEIASCYMCNAVGLQLTNLDQNASYVANWLQKLKNDNRLIFQASSAASYASNWCLQQAGLLEAKTEEVSVV